MRGRSGESRPGQAPRYVPPKPVRWHEDLHWRNLAHPATFALLLTAALIRGLPSHGARFAAFGMAGVLFGGLVGYLQEDGWWTTITFGLMFGGLALHVYAALWLLHRRSSDEMGWAEAFGLVLVCPSAAVTFVLMYYLATR